MTDRARCAASIPGACPETARRVLNTVAELLDLTEAEFEWHEGEVMEDRFVFSISAKASLQASLRPQAESVKDFLEWYSQSHPEEALRGKRSLAHRT